MSKLIVIIGITGNQGSSVATTFLSLKDWRIRGITRNPSKPSAKAWQEKGVEIVWGDLDLGGESLVEAFLGANVIFAVTDFWAGAFDPVTVAAIAAANAAAVCDDDTHTEKERITINEFAYDRELLQGENIADAASDRRVLATLERFIYSSLSDVKKWSRGKYTHVYHFDSKAQVVQYIKRACPALAARMSTVQIGEYADNWRKFRAFAPQKQADGSFLITKPQPGDTRIPMVVPQKDTGSFVYALVQSPPGTHLLGYGSYIGWEEYARIWGKILNIQAKFKQVPPEEYLQGLFPDDISTQIRESYQYQAEFGWHGGDPDIEHPDELGLDIPTTSIEEYIKSEDWSSVLNG